MISKETKLTRRTLVKISLLGVAVGSVLLTPLRYAWTQALELIDMSMTKRKDETNKKAVGTAKSLNYVEDLEKALKSGKMKKKVMTTPDGRKFEPKQQRCDTCLYFDLQKQKKDTCAIIPGVLVHKPGSCDQWQAMQKS